ncbi:MAG TPA: HEAT repeat domain-containing protein [Longimicrobiales bacterium]
MNSPLNQVDDASEIQGPDAAQVVDLFGLLEKTVRAHRLYQANNPVYQGFLGALRGAFAKLWASASALHITIEEGAFRWQGKTFTVGEGRDSLSFLFYKDGVRDLTFLPGFEDEVGPFLEIVHKARQRDEETDDLVTLLWEREFTGFQYTYMDMLGEELALPEGAEAPSDDQVRRVEPAQVAASASGEDGEPPRPSELRAAEQRAHAPAGVSREDFEETLYFLDETELSLLQREVELEWARDLKSDVLNALLDRLEDGQPARQLEILGIFRQLIPSFLTSGDLASASRILVELSTLLDGTGLAADAHDEAVRLFGELSEPEIVSQLIHAIEEGILDPAGDELGIFLRYLGPAALAVLLRTVETTDVAPLRKRLETAVEAIARAAPEPVAELLQSEDPAIIAGATRLLGRLGYSRAAGAVAALLQKPDPQLRLAAVEALVSIHNGTALDALQKALEDEDRDVRVAAARGLARLRYQPARARLEELIQGRLMREADLTEKIAFFEAFGAVGNADSVAMLDKLLNGKNLLRQKQPPDLRACAALALGRMGTPAAKAALEQAAADEQPMVRNAVARALRQEVAAQ